MKVLEKISLMNFLNLIMQLMSEINIYKMLRIRNSRKMQQPSIMLIIK